MKRTLGINGQNWWVIAFLLGFAALQAASGQSIKSRRMRPPLERVKTYSGVAVPGKGVGELKLGDTRERFYQLFPKKEGIDEQYDYPKYTGCPGNYGDAHWLPPKFEDNGLFVYTIDDKIVQIADHSPRFPTTKGIRPAMVRTPPESTPQAVKRAYPGIDKTLVILGSGAKIVGGRDLIYWVDTKSGIAFEFQYFPNRNRRFLVAVYIFMADSDFIPQACVSEPQVLRVIKLFSLEPPAKLERDWGKKNGINRLTKSRAKQPGWKTFATRYHATNASPTKKKPTSSTRAMNGENRKGD